jgi:phosphate transport system substrate-binding protein
MGSVVLIVNLPGVADNALRLTAELVVDIFLGKITRWNDGRIAETNRDIRVPNLPISIAYRADASGTTQVFTTYLARVSSEWQAGPGAGTSVRWPVGNGARGNEGVANAVRNTPGAIGYTENAYATVNRLITTQLRNKSGRFVAPVMASFQAAATQADWSRPGFAADRWVNQRIDRRRRAGVCFALERGQRVARAREPSGQRERADKGERKGGAETSGHHGGTIARRCGRREDATRAS